MNISTKLIFTGLLLLMWSACVFTGSLKIDPRIRQAIQQCEAELPRHQSCEVVITARVKE